MYNVMWCVTHCLRSCCCSARLSLLDDGVGDCTLNTVLGLTAKHQHTGEHMTKRTEKGKGAEQAGE